MPLIVLFSMLIQRSGYGHWDLLEKLFPKTFSLQESSHVPIESDVVPMEYTGLQYEDLNLHISTYIYYHV